MMKIGNQEYTSGCSLKIRFIFFFKGNRSLKENLEMKNNSIDSSNAVQSLMSVDDADEEIPERIEEVIEMLLKGLRDKV
jgi:hypothetical protein